MIDHHCERCIRVHVLVFSRTHVWRSTGVVCACTRVSLGVLELYSFHTIPKIQANDTLFGGCQWRATYQGVHICHDLPPWLDAVTRRHLSTLSTRQRYQMWPHQSGRMTDRCTSNAPQLNVANEMVAYFEALFSVYDHLLCVLICFHAFQVPADSV